MYLPFFIFYVRLFIIIRDENDMCWFRISPYSLTRSEIYPIKYRKASYSMTMIEGLDVCLKTYVVKNQSFTPEHPTDRSVTTVLHIKANLKSIKINEFLRRIVTTDFEKCVKFLVCRFRNRLDVSFVQVDDSYCGIYLPKTKSNMI